MIDSFKFKILVFVCSGLVVITLAYPLIQELVMPDIEGYVQRKLHYERVISQKGLTLHKAMYWKGKP